METNQITKKNGNLRTHHIRPSSRGGNSEGNLVKIPEDFHKSWHIIFGNLLWEEAQVFIERIFKGKNGNGKKSFWTNEELENLREEVKNQTVMGWREKKMKKRNGCRCR